VILNITHTRAYKLLLLNVYSPWIIIKSKFMILEVLMLVSTKIAVFWKA